MPNYENIDDLMSAQSPQAELLKHTRKLVEKWEPTGLLDGIDDESKKSGMSVLLENQASQLVKEASQTSTASNKEEWSGVALPLVRRIFGELAAQDFVSVQPMNLPSGLIFYLDFKYGSANALAESGGDIFGNTSGSGDASGGLYGAGKFGYSAKSVSKTGLAIAGSAGANKYVTSSVAHADVDFEPSLASTGSLVKLSGNILLILSTMVTIQYLLLLKSDQAYQQKMLLLSIQRTLKTQQREAILKILQQNQHQQT
jgi:hypothetical protein